MSTRWDLLFFGRSSGDDFWGGSRAHRISRYTDAITALLGRFRPPIDRWGGSGQFCIFIFVDDCMLIECPVGKRLQARSDCCGWSCKQLLGGESINTTKKCEEGHWGEKRTLLGFTADTARMAVKLPRGGNWASSMFADVWRFNARELQYQFETLATTPGPLRALAGLLFLLVVPASSH